jgi:hypothetical protein
MTTVQVAFADAWLTGVSNPSVSVRAWFPERKSTSLLDGEIRFYAGGRRRIITSARSTHRFPLTLQLLDDPQLALLESWRGQVLLLRDKAGRRVFGTFLTFDVEDWWMPEGLRHIVTLTFTEVTYSEGV